MKTTLLTCWVLFLGTSLFGQDKAGEKKEEHQIWMFLSYAEDAAKPGTFVTVVQITFGGPSDQLKINDAWVELLDPVKKEVYARHKAVPTYEGDTVILRAFFPGAHTHVFPGFVLEIEVQKTKEKFRNSIGRPLDEDEELLKKDLDRKEVPEKDRAKKPPVEKPAAPEPPKKKRGNPPGNTQQVLPV